MTAPEMPPASTSRAPLPQARRLPVRAALTAVGAQLVASILWVLLAPLVVEVPWSRWLLLVVQVVPIHAVTLAATAAAVALWLRPLRAALVALVLAPELLVCDEPASALDVSIQAQVLNLLRELQRELGLTLLFIAHNMGVVEHISDRVAVMYLGRIAEITDRATIYRDPRHPYTRALMSAIPVPDPERRPRRILLPGDVPSPVAPPPGCSFHPRCPLRAELGEPAICATERPVLADATGHAVACHFADRGGRTVAAAIAPPAPEEAA